MKSYKVARLLDDAHNLAVRLVTWAENNTLAAVLVAVLSYGSGFGWIIVAFVAALAFVVLYKPNTR